MTKKANKRVSPNIQKGVFLAIRKVVLTN